MMAEGGEDVEMKKSGIIAFEDDGVVDIRIETEADNTGKVASTFAEQNIGKSATTEKNAIDLPIGWQSDKSLSDSFSVLLEKELWTDVTFTFKTDENLEQVKGHKVMLAARSPVFQAMFFGEMYSTSEIEIADASPESFRLFLKCLYTDNVDLDENSLSQVVQLVHKYQVSHLLDLCSKKLATFICVENACQILDLAVFYNLESLVQKVCDFVDDHVEDILETQGFMDISVETLKVILSGDTFYTKELKLFHRCLEWAESKCQQQGLEPEDRYKRKVLGDAFFFLRLPTMSLTEFTQNVSKTQLLTIEETLKIYQHMGSKSSQEEVGNSITSRKPRSSLALWPKDMREMKFHCPDDVYLIGINLSELEGFPEDGVHLIRPQVAFGQVHMSNLRKLIPKGQPPIFQPQSDADQQPEKQLRDISVQGKITIKEVDLTVKFQTPYLSKLPDFVSLKPNIFLKGKNEPYTLIIEVSCNSSYSTSYLETLRKLFAVDDYYQYNAKEQNYYFTNTPGIPEQKRLLNILYKSFPYSSCQPLIKGVQYTNISNR